MPDVSANRVHAHIQQIEAIAQSYPTLRAVLGRIREELATVLASGVPPFGQDAMESFGSLQIGRGINRGGQPLQKRQLIKRLLSFLCVFKYFYHTKYAVVAWVEHHLASTHALDCRSKQHKA